MTSVTHLDLPQLAHILQEVFGDQAATLARDTGFIQRQSQTSNLTGASFSQALVFAYLSNPQATDNDLSQSAAAVGIAITAQGLMQRLDESAAAFLEALVNKAVSQVLAATQDVPLELLSRFEGVYIADSTAFGLPKELAEIYPGCGSSHGENAVLKIQVMLELKQGSLASLELQPGRSHDQTAAMQHMVLPAGALRLQDLGYFKLENFRQLAEGGGFFLSRLKVGTKVYVAEKEVQLRTLLVSHEQLDIAVEVGKERLPCRLLAQRVPEAVAAKRRERLYLDAKRRGQAVSHEALSLCDWCIWITNVPQAKLSLAEALLLGRCRWQIELLFKLWKSVGGLDETKRRKPYVILCSIYAKLLALLVQHWLFLIGCWALPNKSLVRAAKAVQKHAAGLALAFRDFHSLCAYLERLNAVLMASCRMTKRAKQPYTYQLLLALEAAHP